MHTVSAPGKGKSFYHYRSIKLLKVPKFSGRSFFYLKFDSHFGFFAKLGGSTRMQNNRTGISHVILFVITKAVRSSLAALAKQGGPAGGFSEPGSRERRHELKRKRGPHSVTHPTSEAHKIRAALPRKG